MKKIILITLLVFFIVTGQGLSGNRDRYESSDHKFRSQFNDNEWREHQARSERYFRARHPEYYLYREDRCYHRHKRDYYRCKDSFEYDDIYDDWWDDSDKFRWDDDTYDWRHDTDSEGWNKYEYKHKHKGRWD
ncbi:MAG: hypothetical protein MUE70_08875 [Desulfobacterales bacterium]|nr:hypothetical protein [Desulfobacterales bacterium]